MSAHVLSRAYANLRQSRSQFPADPAWAERARRAHANAIENLAVFATAVLTTALIGVSTPATVLTAESLRTRSGERSLRAESKLAPVESLKTASH